MKKSASIRVEQNDTAPDLSGLPPMNCFSVCEQFRAIDPLSAVLDALNPLKGSTYARVDLMLPLGCPFSLFLVRGYPKNDESPTLAATLCVSRELARALAEQLRDSDILALTVEPRKQNFDFAESGDRDANRQP